MVQANEGMVAGTYYLKGGDSGAAFTENMNVIKTAFDYANHPDRCFENQTSSFYCVVSGLNVGAYSYGYVNASGYNLYDCGVYSDGFSGCGKEPQE